MRLMLIALATAAAAMPAAAHASDWWMTAVTDSSTMYIDMQSIRTEGKWTTAVQRLLFFKPSPSGARSMTVTIQVDCKARQYRVASFAAYTADGKKMADQRYDPTKLNDVGPGTSSEGVYNFVCEVNRDLAIRVADPQTATP